MWVGNRRLIRVGGDRLLAAHDQGYELVVPDRLAAALSPLPPELGDPPPQPLLRDRPEHAPQPLLRDLHELVHVLVALQAVLVERGLAEPGVPEVGAEVVVAGVDP